MLSEGCAHLGQTSSFDSFSASTASVLVPGLCQLRWNFSSGSSSCRSSIVSGIGPASGLGLVSTPKPVAGPARPCPLLSRFHPLRSEKNHCLFLRGLLWVGGCCDSLIGAHREVIFRGHFPVNGRSEQFLHAFRVGALSCSR